jgi:hypothetical protein
MRTIYDNGGQSADRYTVIYEDGTPSLALSDDCHMPNGVCMTCDAVHGEHLGKVVHFLTLHDNVKRCIESYEALGKRFHVNNWPQRHDPDLPHPMTSRDGEGPYILPIYDEVYGGVIAWANTVEQGQRIVDALAKMEGE